MIHSHFFLNNETEVISLQQYIKHNMPTARFVGNPFNTGSSYSISLQYESSDSAKMNEFMNKIYEQEQTQNEPVRLTFIQKIKKFINNIF